VEGSLDEIRAGTLEPLRETTTHPRKKRQLAEAITRLRELSSSDSQDWSGTDSYQVWRTLAGERIDAIALSRHLARLACDNRNSDHDFAAALRRRASATDRVGVFAPFNGRKPVFDEMLSRCVSKEVARKDSLPADQTRSSTGGLSGRD